MNSESAYKWELAKAAQRQAIADRFAGLLSEEQWQESQEKFARAVEERAEESRERS